MDIPPEKTKAYWEKKMPDLRHKASKNQFWRAMLYTLIGGFLIFLFCFFEYTRSGYKEVFLMELLFVWNCFVWIYYYIQRKWAKDKDREIIRELSFYEIEQVWSTIHGSTAEESPVNKIISEDFIVSEVNLFIKLKCQKYRYLPMRALNCICSKEKQEEIEKLIHMKERLTLRKESRRFKVTYKKYSKELVRIDLCEDEEYPAHCHYEELIERINIMF